MNWVNKSLKPVTPIASDPKYKKISLIKYEIAKKILDCIKPGNKYFICHLNLLRL